MRRSKISEIKRFCVSSYKVLNRVIFVKVSFLLIAIVVVFLNGVWIGNGNTVKANSNYSIRFKGNDNYNSYIGIPLGNRDEGVNIGAGDFTIEFWMKHEDDGFIIEEFGCKKDVNFNEMGGAPIMDRSVRGSRPGQMIGEWGIYLMRDKKLAFLLSKYLPPVSSIDNVADVSNYFFPAQDDELYGKVTLNVCSPVLQRGVWYYIAVVRRGGNIKLYVDGKLVDENTNEAFSKWSDFSYPPDKRDFLHDTYLGMGATKEVFSSGRPGTVSPGSFPYKGLLDEVRISKVGRNISGKPTSPFSVDSHTTALYRFERNANSETGKGNADKIGDVEYVQDTPFPRSTATDSRQPNNTTPTGTNTLSPTITSTNLETISQTTSVDTSKENEVFKKNIKEENSNKSSAVNWIWWGLPLLLLALVLLIIYAVKRLRSSRQNKNNSQEEKSNNQTKEENVKSE